jgi:hypothetical protein
LVSNRNVSMRVRPIIAVLLFLAPSLLRAMDVSWPARFGNWTSSSEPAQESAAVAVPDESASSLLQESGVLGSSARTYRNRDRFVGLRLYTFRDSSGAYEAYTLLRALAAVTNIPNVVVVKSNLVLWIHGIEPPPDDRKALESWMQANSDQVSSPPVPSYLPEKGLEEFSERYALGPVGFREAANSLGRASFGTLTGQVGFSSGAEAAFARYKNGSEEAVLLLIDYPTPQLAELHLHHLQSAISANAEWAGTSLDRKGSLLSIVLGTSSTAYANRLRSAVNYETQVTWNEPRQTATDPPITSILVKIIIGTGVFMVLAVVLGIAFGGVRVITKRFFPGKVFDRPEQMEVLQLGLSGKPIDPRDFY